jgi:hypothetical protein
MALINNQGQYIRLCEKDCFEIYTSSDARQRFKAATTADEIVKKYTQILMELDSSANDEARYYNSEEFNTVYNNWLQEFQRYYYNFLHGIFGQDYPLMAEYYPDVKDSIPEIIMKGMFGQQRLPVAEAYVAAKENKTYGETTDA